MRYLVYLPEIVDSRHVLDPEDPSFVLVDAPTPEAAIRKYANQIYACTRLFREQVATRTVNMSFAEQFWLSNDSVHHDEPDHLDLVEPEEFKRRVRNYFGVRTDLSDIFIEWFFDENNPSTIELPEAMYRFVAERECVEWTNAKAVRLDELTVITSKS